MKLTELQLKAVEAKGRNVIVSAGAGTGKTRVLVERFLHFVVSGECTVTEILALTFTDKAANEMKSRILDRLSELGLEAPRRELEAGYISTIHAFASRLLREHPLESGVDPDFRVLKQDEADLLKEQALDKVIEEVCVRGSETFEMVRIYGESRLRAGLVRTLETAGQEGKAVSDFFVTSGNSDFDAQTCVREVAERLNRLGESDYLESWQRFSKIGEWDWQLLGDFQEWCSLFSRKRGKKGDDSWAVIKESCRLYYAAILDQMAGPWKVLFEQMAVAFEKTYADLKRERGVLDFDDLQLKAVNLLKRAGKAHEKIRERYRKQFRHILVDEFQDTNYLQYELVRLLSDTENLFFVGDFKQSIYAFRGAEPQLFLDLEKTNVRIPLLENFRSSETVLGFVNEFFREIWEEDGLPFEPLFTGRESTEGAETELLNVEREEGEGLDRARMREADRIASRILELNEEGAEFGEMAVLFQAMTDIGIYEQALKKKGIPYYAISGRGFYHQPEIRDMLSFLSFLENPLSDIALAASLRSPLFQISDSTLFWISDRAKSGSKSGEKTPPLYQGVKQFMSIDEIDMWEKTKLQRFLAIAGDLLAVKDRLKLTELVDRILEKTSYELTVLADSQGIRRYANLKKMVSLAREFEGHEPMPLGAFLQAVRRLETQEARESEAQIEAEQSKRVVRLMSIHKAKGLEFPVVFVADLGRSRQSADSGAVTAMAAAGYGLQVRNERTLKFEKPLSWLRIDEALKQKDKEQWKRLLYVAMTRAEKKLILSGVSTEKMKDESKGFHDMGSWMDWLLAAESAGNLKVSRAGKAKPRKGKKAPAEKKSFREVFPDLQPVEAEVFLKSGHADEISRIAGSILSGAVCEPQRPSRVIDLPVSAYASYQKSPEAFLRTYEIGFPDSDFESEPSFTFTEEPEVSARDFGIAVHSLLERLHFRNPDENREELLAEIFRGFPEKSQKEAAAVVDTFLASGLYQDLKKARLVKKELPFVLNERHGLIYGVMDVLYCDAAGKWHIVDYKTAEGAEGKSSKAGYDLQVKIYARAAEKILGVQPASAVVYYLKNHVHEKYDFDRMSLKKIGDELNSVQEAILAHSLPETADRS